MKKLFIALTLSASLLSGCGSDFTPVTPDSGRRAHTAVVISGKMYVFGGLGDGTFLNDLWEYDIVSNSWSQKNPAVPGPGARTYAAAVTDGLGNMYVLGGYDGTSTTKVFYNDIWEYAPGTNEWTSISSSTMPAVSGHSAVYYSNNIFIFGGYDGTDYVNTLWKCSLTGSCITLDSGPTKRSYHSAVVATDPSDGSTSKMYVFGGLAGDVKAAVNVNDLWAYNFTSQLWEVVTVTNTDDMKPAARSKHTAVLGIDGATPTLFVFGGVGSTSNKIWIYDIGTKTWTENPDEIVTAPASRASHSAVMHSSMMYIYGGYVSSGATLSLNDLWEFEPAPVPDLWTQKTSPPRQ